MATKYAGQNALNKLMQLVKTALNNKADKTNATTSVAGLMSAADKTKLDGIAAGANKTTVDDTMSSTSTNPVQNKAIKKYVDDHAADDAVLYTAQTLTSAQKKQARQNIEAASEFVINGTFNDDGTASLDAPFVEIQEAANSGKVPVVHLRSAASTATRLDLQLFELTPTYVTFTNSATDTNGLNHIYTLRVTSEVPASFKVSGLQTASQVQDAIKSAITGVYTPKGSIAFASLPTAAAGNKGWVYNVTNAFTTTAAFVEGAGHSYGAGTNVVCVDAGSGSYKWDVLAGTIDLTELTADEVQTLWDSI